MSQMSETDFQKRMDEARVWGHDEMRPAGLEADQKGAPLPPEHPYFQKFLDRGWGRTAWKAKAGPRMKLVQRFQIAEEYAYWDRGMGVANPGPGLPEGLALGVATDEQRERFLTRFIDPDKPRWASLAMTEPGGGSDTAAFRTRAKRDGKEWVLSGAKCFIGNASRADWIIVQATTDPEKGRAGQRSFFVEKGTPGLGGFRIEKKMGLKAYESTSFSLEDCRIPLENVVGEVEPQKSKGYGSAMRTLNATRPIVAATALGIARAARDEATRFVKEAGLEKDARIRDRLEMYNRRWRAAWLMTAKASWLADEGKPNIVEASLAKAHSADVVEKITMDAMDLIGTIGARGDHLIEKFFRDAKAMNIVEGTGQIQRMIVARQMLDLPK